ncbi:MAG: hypothetical protein RR053_02575 [Evtepia sp.]
MKNDEKKQLIKGAVRLCSLGKEVEESRKRIRKLAKKSPVDSLEMLDALDKFLRVNDEWKRLEIEHLSLRENIKRQDN